MYMKLPECVLFFFRFWIWSVRSSVPKLQMRTSDDAPVPVDYSITSICVAAHPAQGEASLVSLRFLIFPGKGCSSWDLGHGLPELCTVFAWIRFFLLQNFWDFQMHNFLSPKKTWTTVQVFISLVQITLLTLSLRFRLDLSATSGAQTSASPNELCF